MWFTIQQTQYIMVGKTLDLEYRQLLAWHPQWEAQQIGVEPNCEISRPPSVTYLL